MPTSRRASATRRSSPASRRASFLEEEGDDIFGQKTRIYGRPTNPTYVEVFLATHPFPLRALARRRRVRVPPIEAEAWIISAEDLLLMKAAHVRHPSRPRFKAAQDRADTEGVLAAQRGRLDVALLRKEARELGIGDEVAAWA